MKPTPEQIDAALQQHGGNKTAAANELGVNRWVVWNHCKDRKVESETATHRQLRRSEAELQKLRDKLDHEIERRRIAERDLQAAIEQSMIVEELDENEVVAREIEKFKRDTSTSGGCTAIICATDWHLEKCIQPSTVSGLNEFNLDIAQRRIDKFWQKSSYLVELWSHIADVDETVLWLGGDLVNGYLHDEDVEANFCGPAEAILAVQEHVATGIDHLEKSVSLDRIVCNYGNHGRTTRYMRPATGWKTSWEYLAYKNLERIYGQYDWTIAQGYMNYLDIQGHKVRFHHGENVKYYGGVGGLTIPMNKATQAWDKSRRVDLSINGHFHQYIDTWNWVSVGCLCGFDAYAQSIKAEFQEPTQAVILIDKSRGKVASLPVFVESADAFQS